MKRERVSSFRKHGTCLGRMKVFYRWGLGSLCAILLALLSSSTALADNIFVANGISGGTIGEYTTSGATVNAALISGLNTPTGIAIIPSTVPEPATLTLLGLGLIGLMGLRRKDAQ